MLWIKEVEMFESVDDLKSSCSIGRIRTPVLKYSTRKLLQHWTESSIIPASWKRSVWRNKKPKKRTVSFEEDRSLTWSMSTSGSQEPMIPATKNADLLSIALRNEDTQELHSKWDEILLNPIWWHLGRIVQVKKTSAWETQDRIGIVQFGDSSEESRSWLSQIEDDGEKRSIKQNLRMKNFVVWNGKCETNRGQESGDKTAWAKNSWRLLAVENQRGSVLKETVAVSVTMSISVQNRHSRILLWDLLRDRMREMRWEPEVPEAKVPVEECLDGPARITSKELAPIHSVKSCILQSACSTSRKMDADLEKSALMRTARLMNSPAKGLKRMVTKVQWLCWKVHDNWVEYFKKWSRRSLHRFRGRAQTYGNQSDVFNSLKPSYVMLTFETKSIAWHPHQRNTNAQKFDDRSQEETEWQERCAREASWRLAKNIQHSSHLRKMSACLHHSTFTPERENLLWTPDRRRTWSAKRTWILLIWILWRRWQVQRQS